MKEMHAVPETDAFWHFINVKMMRCDCAHFSHDKIVLGWLVGVI